MFTWKNHVMKYDQSTSDFHSEEIGTIPSSIFMQIMRLFIFLPAAIQKTDVRIFRALESRRWAHPTIQPVHTRVPNDMNNKLRIDIAWEASTKSAMKKKWHGIPFRCPHTFSHRSTKLLKAFPLCQTSSKGRCERHCSQVLFGVVKYSRPRTIKDSNGLWYTTDDRKLL